MPPSQHRFPALERTAWQQREAILDRFEEAWRQGQTPAIADFLALTSEEHRRDLLVELVLLELEFQRAAGQTVEVADYVQRFPVLVADALLQKLQTAECRLREAAKAAVSTSGPLWNWLANGSNHGDGDGQNPSSSLELSRNFPGYEVVEELGRGAMGVVYKAWQTALKRPVAIKVILHGAHSSAEQLARFRREAEAAAQLQHPHVVQIYEVGQATSGPYLAMEYVAGGTLAQRLVSSPLSVREAAQLVETLARTMHVAHQHRIIHRDLKPSNILLTADGQPRIADFGLAKQLTEETLQTQSGAILGTPCYMAPEQAAGKAQEIGPATDVYALGAILYELLTGHPPFRATTALETMQLVLHEEPLAPTRLQPGILVDVETICLKCLHKEPARRYDSALELAEDLQRTLNHEPIRARPVGLWERGLKWARRHPAWAAVLLISLLSMLAVIGGTAAFTIYLHTALEERTEELRAEQRERDRQAQEFQTQRDRAAQEQARLREKQVQERQRLMRQSLYLSDMHLAHQFWKDAEPQQGLELLRRHLPTDGEEDRRGFEWYYLWRQCHRELRTLSAHQGTVFSADFSPDGKTLATGGADRLVKLWDTTTWQVRSTLRGHVGPVCAVAFASDGQTLASADEKLQLRLWNPARGEQVASFAGLQGERTPQTRLAFSPDGRVLAMGGCDPFVQLWDLTTQKRLPSVVQDALHIMGVAFSGTGRELATCGGDSSARVWDWRHNEECLRLKPTFASVTSAVAWAHRGRMVATGDATGLIELWDSADGRRLGAFSGHTGPVWSLAFSPDDQVLASAGEDRLVRLWDLRTRKLWAVLHGHTDVVRQVAFSPDGTTLASASKDQTVRLWKATDWRTEHALKPSLQAVGPVAFSPDGQTLAVANQDQTVQLLDRASGRARAILSGHDGPIRALGFSPDGQRLASAGDDRDVLIWDRSGRLIATFREHQGPVTCLAFSPNSQQLASGGEDRVVLLWDLAAKDTQVSRPLVLREHTRAITSVAFAPAGKTLISASADGTVKLWDLPTGQRRASLEQGGRVNTIAVSPDGHWLVAATEHSTVAWWNLKTCRRREPEPVAGNHGPLRQLTFSPDGKLLAGANFADTICVLDGRTGTKLHDLYCRSVPVTQLSFGASSQTLATGSSTGCVLIWDLANWRVQKPLDQPPLGVSAMAFSPDGKILYTQGNLAALGSSTYSLLGVAGRYERVIAGNGADVLRCWDVATGQATSVLNFPHPLALHSLALAPNGCMLTAGSEGGMLWRWDLPSGTARRPQFISKDARSYWEQASLVRLLPLPVSPLFNENVGVLAYSPDGQLLAVASHANAADHSIYRNDQPLWSIRILDAATCKVRATLSGRFRQIGCLMFTQDGSTLISNDGATLNLWDVATGQLRRSLTGAITEIRCAALAVDGQILATGGRDRRITLWDLPTGKKKAVLLGHTDTVTALDFNVDGKTLASGGWDGNVKLWNLASGVEVMTLQGHRGPVRCVVFSRDGGVLASGGETPQGGGEVFLWRTAPPVVSVTR